MNRHQGGSYQRFLERDKMCRSNGVKRYKALHAVHLPFTIKFLLHVHAVFVHPFSVSAFPALMVTWVLEPIAVVLE